MSNETILFEVFPKTARLRRECVITEKIDGTNAQIYITEDGQLFTGSRNRWVTPEDDNYGFAAWARDNRDELLTLGPGRHFGEWWGQGIQRKYGQSKKWFSLFNTLRWCGHYDDPLEIPSGDPQLTKWQTPAPSCCLVVPVLYRGTFSSFECGEAIRTLRLSGSVAAPGFDNPEGIVCYHVAARVGFKQTIHGDEVPKGKRA